MNTKEVIITGAHLDLTDALKTLVNDKVERLFKHKDRIVRIRVELVYDNKRRDKEEFTAKGRIEIQGPDIHASETTDDLYKSIDLMIDKLDRQLLERGRQQRHERKHPHDVDLPSHLPKTGN